MCLLLESNEFWVKRFVSVLPEIQVNVIYNMYNKKYYLGGSFMKEEEIVLKVENYIKDKMYNESSGHDWWHVKRVHDLALKINENENANEFTVKMIALLHDIYDSKFSDGNVRDNLIELMKKLNILNDINEEKLENILFSIENLSFKGGFNSVELSKEGQIVQDADRIDAIGAIGIARCFAYNGKKGNPIYDPEVRNYRNFIRRRI